MSSRILKSMLAAVLTSGLATGAAQAYEAGNLLVRAGVYGVFPESNNLNNVLGLRQNLEVEDAYSLGFNLTYMLNPNLGIEVLGALPFKHDVKVTGGIGKVAETKHLPPTISLQYHLLPQGSVHPYVGLGLNYTRFFSEKGKGALRDASIKLDDSWGVAAQLGIDVDVAPNWFVNADLRYINIESDLKVNGNGVGTVDINPWVFGLTMGTRF